MDELNDALNEMTTALGAAVEMTAFLFHLLIDKGFTRAEALSIVKDYLLGMLTTGGKNEKK